MKPRKSKAPEARPNPGGLASPACHLHEFADWWTGPEELVRLRRAYDTPSAEDGARFLIDRLWPRGLKRESLQLAAWLKEVAPSDSLRRWFGHEPARWEEFRRRYRTELDANPEALSPLTAALKHGPVTLVFAARDVSHNHALVLRDLLLQSLHLKPHST